MQFAGFPVCSQLEYGYTLVLFVLKIQGIFRDENLVSERVNFYSENFVPASNEPSCPACGDI